MSQQQQQQQQQQSFGGEVMASSSFASTEHAADEAGGEVVYTSDGMEPLAVPTPTSSAAIASRNRLNKTKGTVEIDGDGAVVETYEVNPEDAFEVFAGKVYYHHRDEKQGAGGGGGAGGETALERLARIHRELNEVEQDLVMSTSTAVSGDAGPAPGGVDVDAFLKSVQELKTKLKSISMPSHEHLTSSIRQSAQSIQATTAAGAGGGGAESAGAGTGIPSEIPPPPPPAASALEAASSVGTVPGAPSTSRTDRSLELRLQRMEHFVGAGHDRSSSGRSLVERLIAMERSVSKLDDTKLDALVKRAKVVRQDLEAASKARNKLVMTTSGGGGAGAGGAKAGEDSKTIADLHDQMVQLQGMADHLPALAQRLRALSHVHNSASSWSSRLQNAEALAEQARAQLLTFEKALDLMEQGLRANVARITNNMKSLDERLDQVSMSLSSSTGVSV